MANYSTSEFKGGLKIMQDGEPCSIVENEMVKPGKGQAFNRVKIRKLISGKVVEKTFKSGESVEGADVIELELSLVEQDVCTLTLWEGKPINVQPPNFVELEITETDPGLKGDTAGTGGKPATLSTGAVVRVPLFVQIGEVIKVDTRPGEYVSRVQK